MAAPAERPATFTEAIDHWCQRTPDAMALRLLDERGEVAAERTYGDLGRAITAAAALVAQRVGPGDAAVLLFPPGLEFIEAFFGCLKAGVVAVPVYPPDPMRLSATISRLVSIVDDARPAVILTDSLIAEHAELLFAEAPSLRRVPLVDVGAGGPSTAAARPQAVSPEDVAFVQYSSGSTGEPKGVVLSHANLDANLRSIEAAFGIDPAVDTGLSWLPTYHDMGLIGAVIQPLTIGGLTYLMSPIDFLRRPWSWLEAMSRYGCTISGSPNFGYELCARKTPDEVVEQLDLTRWRVAFNGAEPLDPGTLEAFTERFAPAGFAAAAMLPCYGLAEATLLVSGKRPTDPPKVLTVDPGALSDSRLVLAHDGRRLVSCGRPSAGVEVRIVDPTTGEPLPDGHVGEIEVAGGSVAKGYWARQPDRPAFREVDGRGWLRTGDLGGLVAGELVPTGRIKDVLVVRGRNVYPQDLERAAEAADPTLRRGCSVAFAVEPGQDERIVLVTEVAGGDPTPELAEAISAAVAQEGVRPAVVVLAPPHSVPKTSSGKVRRAACRAAWQAGTLGALLERGTGDRERPESATGEGARALSVAGTADLIRAEVERALADPEAQLSGELVFADLGLDSAQLVELIRRGVPTDGIRFIQEAKSDDAKAALFAACRDGSVAVLVGSTETMGVGTNVQNRVVAVHQVDGPWRPADVEQRDGRGIRQGNKNPEVHLIRYVTERSFDPYQWQTLERKAAFIGQVTRGDLGEREVEDIGDQTLSFQEVKALATGDPLILEKATVDAEVARLTRLERAHRNDQQNLRRTHDSATAKVDHLDGRIADLEAAVERLDDTRGDRFAMAVDDRHYRKRPDAGAHVHRLVADRLVPGSTPPDERKDWPVGHIGGHDVRGRRVAFGADAEVRLSVPGTPIDLMYLVSEWREVDPASVVSRVERQLQRLPSDLERLRADRVNARSEAARAGERLGRAWDQADELTALCRRQQVITDALTPEVPAEPPPERGRTVASVGAPGLG